jgi:hypothetical protein
MLLLLLPLQDLSPIQHYQQQYQRCLDYNRSCYQQGCVGARMGWPLPL